MTTIAVPSWGEVALGEVVTLHYGKALPLDQRNPNGAVPVYGANGVKDTADHHYAEGPSLVIGRKGSAGQVTRVDGPFWPLDVTYFTSHDRSRLDFSFLQYSLANLKLPKLARGVKPGINRNEVYAQQIPLPPLEEQRRIVAVLDEAFEGLDRARSRVETNLRDGKELFDEEVSACFRNVPEEATHSTLGHLAEFRNGLNFTRTSQGDAVKIVGVGDFKGNFEVPVTKIGSARINGQLNAQDQLKSGDLLVVRSNGNRHLIGRIMLVPEIDEKISFSGFTIRIRLRSDCMFPEYLCSYMQTKEARESLTAGGGGANISNLNQRLLASFPVIFPDVDAQLQILGRVQVIQSTNMDLFQRYDNALSDLDELRQSLLQRAFSGELT